MTVRVGLSDLLGLCAVLLAAPSPLSGEDEVGKLIGRKVSPGVVALLAQYTTDERVPPVVAAAISDRSPAVRAVAARVVGVGNLSRLLPQLRDSLALESDPDTAREAIRTLCAVGGPDLDAETLEATRRFGGRLDGAYVRVLARLREAALLPRYFSTLRTELALKTPDRRAFFGLVATRSGLDSLAAAGSYALSHKAVDDWEAILAVASDRGAVVQEGVLVAALGADEPGVRSEAAWYMAKSYQRRRPAKPDDILKAMDESPVTDADPERRFGFEMLRRVLGRPAAEDQAWIACLETNLECHLDSDFVESPLTDLLTDRERQALFRRNHVYERADARSGGPADKAGTRAAAPQPLPEASSLRLVSGLPRGLAADLMSVGGCSSSSSIAEVVYGTAGLPRRVKAIRTPESPACHSMATTILLMSTAPESLTDPEGGAVMVAFLDTACLVCNEEQAAFAVATPDPGVLRIRARVVPPKLQSKVDPSYPQKARDARLEGQVVYQAIISPTGCVREIRLARRVDLILDLAGLAALARWRYTPATLDGQPVPVYLTVTVTFNLHR